MRYAGSELPNHFQFLRLPECRLGLFALLRLGALALDCVGQLACALVDALLEIFLEITQRRLGAQGRRSAPVDREPAARLEREVADTLDHARRLFPTAR